MVPTETIRRYPFFAGFSFERLTDLAQSANEVYSEAGYEFFHEGDYLKRFYLVLEGKIGITLQIPDREMIQPLNRQITNDLITRDVVVSNVGVGELFGWSALIPPNISTANAKALTTSRVLEFNYQALEPIIEEDCCFGHMLTLKAARVIRERMRDQRIEMLAEVAI